MQVLMEVILRYVRLDGNERGTFEVSRLRWPEHQPLLSWHRDFCSLDAEIMVAFGKRNVEPPTASGSRQRRSYTIRVPQTNSCVIPAMNPPAACSPSNSRTQRARSSSVIAPVFAAISAQRAPPFVA